MNANTKLSWYLTVASIALLPSATAGAAPPTHSIVQRLTVPAQVVLTSSGDYLQASAPIFHGELYKFSPSIGTLEDVEIAFDSRWTLFGTPSVLPGSVHGEVIGGVAWDGAILRILNGQGTFPVFSQQPFAHFFELDEVFSIPVTSFVGEGHVTVDFPVAVFGNTYFLSPTNTEATLGLVHFALELTYRYTPIPEPGTLTLLVIGVLGTGTRRRQELLRALATRGAKRDRLNEILRAETALIAVGLG